MVAFQGWRRLPSRAVEQGSTRSLTLHVTVMRRAGGRSLQRISLCR